MKGLSSSKQSSRSCMEEKRPILKNDHHFSSTTPEESSPQPPRKKQVRRRLHTSRPCQERLLNMAEARREIVTALKLHRASMNRTTDQQKQQFQQLQQYPSPPQQAIKEPHSLVNSQQASLVPHFNCSSSSWDYPKISPMPISRRQPLGLNLNSQALANAETPLLISNSNKASSSSSLPTIMSSGTADERSVANMNRSDLILHPAMGDEEMAEIRSISEKHEMEWNDAVNLVMSAWWSKLLKAVEADGSESRDGEVFEVFSEEMDKPAWLTYGSEMDCNGDWLLENH